MKKLIPKHQTGNNISKDERLKRQAFAESRLNPNAISPAGALGPLQIRQDAYTDYQKGTGDNTPYNKVTDFNHAIKVRNWLVDNIADADFIKGKPHTDQVKLAKIYGSYNWGKNNMADYLNKVKSKGVDIYNSTGWVKGLPEETQGYLNKILSTNDPQFEAEYKKISSNPNIKYFKKRKYKVGGNLIPKKQEGDKFQFDGTYRNQNDVQRVTDYINPKKETLLEKGLNILDIPQKAMIYGATTLTRGLGNGVYDTPSNIMRKDWNLKNTGLNKAGMITMDLALDPLNLLLPKGLKYVKEMSGMKLLNPGARVYNHVIGTADKIDNTQDVFDNLNKTKSFDFIKEAYKKVKPQLQKRGGTFTDKK